MSQDDPRPTPARTVCEKSILASRFTSEPLVTCDVCGCVVPESIAKARQWGTMLGKPSCSIECAEVLYHPEIVKERWRAGLPAKKESTNA